MAPTPTVCAPAATATKDAITNAQHARTKLNRMAVSLKWSCRGRPLARPDWGRHNWRPLLIRVGESLPLTARSGRSGSARQNLPAIELVQLVDDPRVGPSDLFETA